MRNYVALVALVLFMGLLIATFAQHPFLWLTLFCLLYWLFFRAPIAPTQSLSRSVTQPPRLPWKQISRQ